MPLRIPNDSANNGSYLIDISDKFEAEELTDNEGVQKKASSKSKEGTFTLTRKSSKHRLSRDDDGKMRGNLSMPNLGYISNGLKRSKSRELNRMNEPFQASSRSRRYLKGKSQGSLLNASFSAMRHVHNSGSLSNEAPRQGGSNASFNLVSRAPGTSPGLRALESLTSSTFSTPGGPSQFSAPLSKAMEHTVTENFPSHSSNVPVSPSLTTTNPLLSMLLSRPKSSAPSTLPTKKNPHEGSAGRPALTISAQNGLNHSNINVVKLNEVKPNDSTDPVKEAPTSNEDLKPPKVFLDSDPQTTLLSILHSAGYLATMRKFGSPQLKDFFSPFTEEHISGYTQEVVTATRKGDLQTLRELYQNGLKMHCANQFGESIVHIACRRGNVDIVRFLLEEAKCPLRVKDDFGRTPFHDACWSVDPNFELMDLLISHDVDLFLIEDKRGHSPFSYARRNHWRKWTEYLLSRKEKLRLKTFVEPLLPEKTQSPKEMVTPVIG